MTRLCLVAFLAIAPFAAQAQYMLRSPTVTCDSPTGVGCTGKDRHFVFCDPRNNKAGQRFLS